MRANRVAWHQAHPPGCRSGAGLRWTVATVGVAMLCGCAGRQSALDPAGRGAEQIADLFWWMTGGLVVIWCAVVGLAAVAARSHPDWMTRREAASLIIGGGVIIPTAILTVLLVFGLALLPAQLAPAPEGSLTVHVIGEQWWWRVRYERPGREPVELANEIRLPVDQPVEFRLDSADVIHSFWIPPLGGKMDMIPGRTTRLALHPTRTGIFRGACAEYCGGPHALMAFDVIVETEEDFTRWLDRQAKPAQPASEPLARRGQAVFRSSGCGACHAVRGTDAAGGVGPDLTHVGSRESLGAALLPNDRAGFERWISETHRVKPQVHMPHFDMLPPDDLEALAAYLDELQ